MKSVPKLLNKLRRPPAAHNWVKSIKPRRDKTAFALHNFALFPPRTSLRDAISICGQIVYDGIDLEQALKCTDAIKNPENRIRAHWIVKAFFSKARKEGWNGIQIFRDMVEYFPVSAGVRVPVEPTFVLNQNGKLTPYFLICWAQMGFTLEQKSLFSTIITKTILTLEEFRDSDAVIVCTPLAVHSKLERDVFSWRVKDFPLLDDEKEREIFDRYAAALDDAEKMLIESLNKKG